MSTKAPSKPRPNIEAQSFSPEEMLKVYELLKGSNSLELKLTVAEDRRREAYKGLAFDPVEAEPRQVYFFDTPDLDLNQAGVVVRARRNPGGKADTVVKLRPVDPSMLDRDLRRSPGFKIEVDSMPGGYVCSASLKGVCSSQEVFDVHNGKVPIESIFSQQQRAFYAAHAPAGLMMNALASLGPTFQLRVRYQPKKFDRRVTIEYWLYPDGSRIYEVSTKGTPSEAFQLSVQFRAFLANSGVAIEKSQGTKTSSALSFFSKELKKSALLAGSEAVS